MSEENKALIHRWFEEVWNKGRAEAIDEMFAEEAVAHGLAEASGQELRGPAGFKPFFQNFRDAFPDIRVIVEDTIAEGDKVATRLTLHAVHTGEFQGMLATGKQIAMAQTTIHRIRDGKITEVWVSSDDVGMMKQLGLMPSQAG